MIDDPIASGANQNFTTLRLHLIPHANVASKNDCIAQLSPHRRGFSSYCSLLLIVF